MILEDNIGQSPLSQIRGLGIVSQFPLNPMHLFFSGSYEKTSTAVGGWSPGTRTWWACDTASVRVVSLLPKIYAQRIN